MGDINGPHAPRSNEVVARTGGLPGASDQIELYNSTNAAINIGGWYLSDTDDDFFKFQVPDPTMVGAGDFVVQQIGRDLDLAAKRLMLERLFILERSVWFTRAVPEAEWRLLVALGHEFVEVLAQLYGFRRDKRTQR